MLQLLFNMYTCDHATCFAFSLRIMEYICNLFSIMIPIDIINRAINVPLLNY